MIEISVNLATHNRADFLEPCLLSLCAQSISPQRYEICVVNNACTDNTPQVVEKIAARHPQHRIFMVREPVAGLSRARNCGIRSTCGALIANIDDDATAAPDWLEQYLNCFASLPPDIGIVGGEIEPVWQAPPPEWLEPFMKGALSAASNMGPAPRFIKPGEGLFEGNCCYRRRALEEAGLYPLELGRVGNSLLSGEGALHLLVQHKGWRLYYTPAAVIRHFIHADRLNPQWFRKRFFWQGISGYAMHRYHVRHGLPMTGEITIDLPLRAEDWHFVNQDSAENLRDSLMHFESLGFALALSGIIPVEE